MAGLTFTKKQRKRMADLLDEQHFEDADDAAGAVLELALELLAERVKFAVVSRLTVSENKPVPPNDERALPFVLGMYATATTANSDAMSMYYSTQTHEQHESMVVPMRLMTPAAYYRTRKDAREQEALADKSFFQRELARRIEWVKDNPGKPMPDDMQGVVPYYDPTEQTGERTDA